METYKFKGLSENKMIDTFTGKDLIESLQKAVEYTTKSIIIENEDYNKINTVKKIIIKIISEGDIEKIEEKNSVDTAIETGYYGA